MYAILPSCGPGNSVGIATDYELDGSGIKSWCGEIFLPSRPALGPTQHPVQWVPGLSRDKVRPGRAANHSPPSSAEVLKEWSYNSTPLWATTGSVTGLLSLLYSLHNEEFNPLNPELNPICYLLALLGAHHFLYVSRIRVKLLTFRLLMSYIYGAPILDVSRSHTTRQHSR